MALAHTKIRPEKNSTGYWVWGFVISTFEQSWLGLCPGPHWAVYSVLIPLYSWILMDRIVGEKGRGERG